MAKLKNNNLLTRIFITLLGVAFIAWGISTVILRYFGVKETAVITNIRREEGERNEAIRGRYTYIISYRFTLPNGENVDGFTNRVADASFLKADGQSKTSVRYLLIYPNINAMEEDTKPRFSQLLFAGIGAFLIYIINRREYEADK